MTQSFKTHNDKPISVGGTWLQGHCEEFVTYDLLVKTFGKPTTGDGYKVDAEWQIEFVEGGSEGAVPRRTVATIYNYKTGKNYCGEEGMEVEEMKAGNWHIGGNDKRALDLVNETLKEAHAAPSKDDIEDSIVERLMDLRGECDDADLDFETLNALALVLYLDAVEHGLY